jgi:hypothetical protein
MLHLLQQIIMRHERMLHLLQKMLHLLQQMLHLLQQMLHLLQLSERRLCDRRACPVTTPRNT